MLHIISFLWHNSRSKRITIQRSGIVHFKTFFRFNIWLCVALIISGLILAPLIVLIITAFSAESNMWIHLINTVLPIQIVTTLTLMTGVTCLTLCFGIPTAWFVTFYHFPGKRILEWMLIFPLTIPTYIVAYIYTDLLDRAGPLYRVWQYCFGHFFWYPNIYSTTGAIFIISFVLYPYVYLAARTSFLQQSTTLIEVARTLGANPQSCFWKIALPIARPTIVIGISLVLMETLNDIGAVEHLGVETLTMGVYNTWLSRGSLIEATRIAFVLLTFIGFLLLLEKLNRATKIHGAYPTYNTILAPTFLSKTKQLSILLYCSIPVILGLIVPISVLMMHALTTNYEITNLIIPVKNSLILASSTAIIVVSMSIFLAYTSRIFPSPILRSSVEISTLGYALPGTILALGILIYLTWIDQQFINFMPHSINNFFEFLLYGTSATLLIAYTIRFLRLSYGFVNAELTQIPQTLDMSARSLKCSPIMTLWRIHIPLLSPTLLAAGLLVFVDTMKELPITLILQPFNFETLATRIYTYASLGQIEDASLPALSIIMIGFTPIFIILRKRQSLYSRLSKP